MKKLPLLPLLPVKNVTRKESSSSTPTGVMTLERYNATEISPGDLRDVNARFSGRLYAYPNYSIDVLWRTDSCEFVNDVSVLISGYLICNTLGIILHPLIHSLFRP